MLNNINNSQPQVQSTTKLSQAVGNVADFKVVKFLDNMKKSLEQQMTIDNDSNNQINAKKVAVLKKNIGQLEKFTNYPESSADKKQPIQTRTHNALNRLSDQFARDNGVQSLVRSIRNLVPAIPTKNDDPTRAPISKIPENSALAAA
jgi:hypothetical protein